MTNELQVVLAMCVGVFLGAILSIAYSLNKMEDQAKHIHDDLKEIEHQLRCIRYKMISHE